MRLRLIAIVVVVITVLGGVFVGRALLDDGSGGGWSHEAGEAWDAERTLTVAFEHGRPNVTLLVEARVGDVDDPVVVAAVDELVSRLDARREIADVESYWSLGRPDWLRNEDGSSALITAWVPGASADYARRADGLAGVIRQTDDAIRVTLGGTVVVHGDIKDALGSTVIPVGLVMLLSLVLVLVFLRNAVATLLVAATAALAVAVTLLGLYGLAQAREMPALAVLLGIACAWGLASANAYLVMSRFISERLAGAGRRDAVVATIGTAGRTVAIASGVVAAVGLSLWILPTTLLRSTSYALGLAGVAGGASAVVGLGLLLAVVGIQVVSHDGGGANALEARPVDPVSQAVARRPLVVGVIGLLLLVPLLPLGFGVATGEPGPIDLAADASSRRVAQVIAGTYPADEAGAPFAVARSVIEFSGADELTAEYAASLSSIEGAVRTDSSEGSFVAGAPVAVPPQVTARYSGEQGTWFLVPVAGNPTGALAHAVVDDIRSTPPPFGVEVGGSAAREQATVEAIGGVAPFFAVLAVLVTVILLAWLLRSLAAALRSVLVVIVMTAGAAVVTWLGFAEGALAPLLGFSTNGSVAAVAPAIAWALSMGVAGAATIFAWGAIREVFDATGEAGSSSAIALAATRTNHLFATLLLVLPMIPLVLVQWAPAQLLGTATLATGLLVMTVGRFVAMPVVTSVAPYRLWPRDEEGGHRRIYPVTPASRHCLTEAEERAAALAVERQLEEEARPLEPEVATPVATPEAPVAPVAVPYRPPPESVEASGAVATPDHVDIEQDQIEVPEAVRPAAAPETEAAPEPGGEEVSAPVEQAAPAADAGIEAPVVPVAEVAPPAEEPPTAAVAEPPSEVTDAPEPPTPEPVDIEVAAAEPVEAETPPVISAVPAPPEDAEAPGDAAAETVEPEPAQASGTVDVASLTESVIAAIEPQTPFTTELGSAYVANPANNLSRVMEAILRDASQRGGEEVLVYGHASRDRYRWMVVDSGPSSDSDPTRAHTLAEAQRFIRRVGGVVECRPEGDFTVFVVEIPMAS